MLNPSWKAGKHLAMFAGLMLVDIYTLVPPPSLAFCDIAKHCWRRAGPSSPWLPSSSLDACYLVVTLPFPLYSFSLHGDLMQSFGNRDNNPHNHSHMLNVPRRPFPSGPPAAHISSPCFQVLYCVHSPTMLQS